MTFNIYRCRQNDIKLFEMQLNMHHDLGQQFYWQGSKFSIFQGGTVIPTLIFFFFFWGGYFHPLFINLQGITSYLEMPTFHQVQSITEYYFKCK